MKHDNVMERGGKVHSEKILWLCDALSMLNALNALNALQSIQRIQRLF
jgi:hypothetical protein